MLYNLTVIFKCMYTVFVGIVSNRNLTQTDWFLIKDRCEIKRNHPYINNNNNNNNNNNKHNIHIRQ